MSNNEENASDSGSAMEGDSAGIGNAEDGHIEMGEPEAEKETNYDEDHGDAEIATGGEHEDEENNGGDSDNGTAGEQGDDNEGLEEDRAGEETQHEGTNGGKGKKDFAAQVAKQLGIDIGTTRKRKHREPSATSTTNQDGDDERSTTREMPASKKKKRASAKEQQAAKPRLDRNVPKDQRLSDKELLQFAKNPKPYERHCAAPYAFSYRGLLYKDYRYLLDLKGADGAHILSGDDKKRLMDSVPAKELNRLYPNVFNSKGQPRKRAPKANKDVHDDETGTYVSPVTKPGERAIGEMNRHALVKSALTDHLDHNTGKGGDNGKKERTSKQRAELEKAALRLAEREVEVDKLEKAIIKIKAGDVAMERDELREERDQLRETTNELTQELEQLTEAYASLKAQHAELQQRFVGLQHAQEFHFNDDDATLLGADVANGDPERIRGASILLSPRQTVVIED